MSAEDINDAAMRVVSAAEAYAKEFERINPSVDVSLRVAVCAWEQEEINLLSAVKAYRKAVAPSRGV